MWGAKPPTSGAGAAMPAAPAPRPAPAGPSFEKVLLEVVSEKTGYPLDMLELDMDLESDLGIDSIKRVEILSGVQERAPDAPTVEPEHLGGLRTLRKIVEFMAARAGEAAPVSAPAP